MARPTDLLIRLRGVNETDTATSEAVANMEAVENAARRTSRETKKDWGGVTDLFSSVLPRGLQRTVRQFKSTTRSVGRLSKSFKVLKAAWASIGIGLIIIALEQIVENWDKITEALGFYNKEAEETKKLNKQIVESQAQLASEMIGYLQIISDLNAEESLREAAIEKMNRQLGDYIDTEASANEQREQAMKLSALALEIDKQRNLQNAVTEKFRIAEAAYMADDRSAEKQQAYIDAAAKVEKVTRDALALEVELNGLILERSEEETARQEALKETARIAANIAKQALADAKYLADLEKRISEEIMLAKIEDDQKRAEEELKLRTQEQVMKALAAGATADQLLLIEEKYLMDLADLREGVKEDDPNVKTPEQIAQEQEALQDEMFLLLMEEQDREETLLMQKYDRRIELANGNRELELEAEKIFLDEMGL